MKFFKLLEMVEQPNLPGIEAETIELRDIQYRPNYHPDIPELKNIWAVKFVRTNPNGRTLGEDVFFVTQNAGFEIQTLLSKKVPAKTLYNIASKNNVNKQIEDLYDKQFNTLKNSIK